MPDPADLADEGERRAKVVVRKGRENYMCLLNLEDATQGGFMGRAAVFAELAARFRQLGPMPPRSAGSAQSGSAEPSSTVSTR